jgi:hypothetical protein
MNPDLADRLARLSPEKRALLERQLGHRPGGSAAQADGIPRRGPDDPAPLSYGQLALWFMEQWEPGSFAYNAALCARVRGPLDLDALVAATERIVERHAVLRTTYRLEPGAEEPVQHVLDTWRLPVRILEHDGSEPGLGDLLRDEARRSFDLGGDVMLRLVVVRIGTDDAVVVLATHHIALDNLSGAILCRELAQAYAAVRLGTDPDLPALDVDYRDFAAWQRKTLAGPRLATMTEHWRRHLAGAPPVLRLPLDHPRPPVQRFEGARCPLALGADVAEGVARAARAAGATSYMHLLASFATLLFRWSSETDVVVGSPVAARPRLELEPLVGLLTNTVATRVRLEGNPTFAEVLAQVRQTSLANEPFAECPFEQVVDAVQPPRDPSHHPLFQVNFRVAPPSAPTLAFAGAEVEPVAIDLGYAKFDLALEVHLRADRLGGHFEYIESLFERSTSEAVAETYGALLRAVLDDPDQRVATLPGVAAPAPGRRIVAARTRRPASLIP